MVIMLICNLIMEKSRDVTVGIQDYRGEVKETLQIVVRDDIWVITDKENDKYCGTVVLQIPHQENDPIILKINLEDNKIFADCFHVIRKKYPKNDFIMSLYPANEEKAGEVLRKAGFQLKERSSQGIVYYYVNGPEEE